MKETHILGAANILKTSWDECWGIMERAVARGRAAKKHQVPALIGVDEEAARKGHSYLTLVSDIERSGVEYIADGRTQASLDPCFESFSVAEREGSEPWSWTCGRPTSTRPKRTWSTPTTRSSSTASTS
jgi:transposase